MRVTALALPVLLSASLEAALSTIDRKAIDQALGATGNYTAAEDTYRLTFPRTDVKVTVDGTPMHPFMGLTSWAAFTSGHAGSMVMGDLVLFEDEVNPVMFVALTERLAVTALHNHFFYDNPRVFFMHISGDGPAGQLGAAVRKTLEKVAELRRVNPEPARQFSGAPVGRVSSIDGAALNQIFRSNGQTNNGMYKIQFGRRVTMHGHAAGNQMGVHTWAAFFGTQANAFVDGDFACTSEELQTVLKGLRSRGINIVAIHNHMAGEEPKLVFLHYWGKGRADQLAIAIRSTLDEQSGSRR